MICCDKCSAKINSGPDELRRVRLVVEEYFPETGAKHLYGQDYVYAPRTIEALCASCKRDLAARIGVMLDEFGAEPILKPEPKEPVACEA